MAADRLAVLVQYSPFTSGSCISGKMLARGLVERGWRVHAVFAQDGPELANYRAAGAEVSVVPHKSWLRTDRPLHFLRQAWREVRGAKAFQSLFKELDPDLVYINTCVSLSAAVAARKESIPIIWHVRELYAPGFGELVCPRVFLPLLVRPLFLRLAQKLVGNSRATLEALLGKSADRGIKIWNAVPDVFFNSRETSAEARARLGLPAEAFLVGTPATFRPMKGQDVFVEALAMARKEVPSLHAVLAGESVDGFRETVAALAARRGVKDIATFSPPIQDMPGFMRACDVICLPSLAEPFGRVVAEAFAAGTSVVAAASGGVTELVADGRRGLLALPGDPASLARAIVRMNREPESAAAMKEAAHEFARKNFSEEACLSMLEGLCRETALQRE